MGIGLERQSWAPVVAKNRADDNARQEKGFPARFFTPAPFPKTDPPNIITSEQAEELIRSRMIPRLENGDPITSTERGKRRHERKGRASGKTP